MKKALSRAALLAILMPLSLYAQTFSGTVTDAATGSVLPYTALRFKNAGNFGLSNEDGNFSMSAPQKDDSLICTRLGYQKFRVLVKPGESKLEIKLQPVPFDLKSVELSAKPEPDYAYTTLYSTLDKYRKELFVDSSKAYCSVMSTTGKEPLEIIEMLGNVTSASGKGLFRLELKNGRIGLATKNEHRYVSLNTTVIVAGFSPFTDNSLQKLPFSPINYSYGKFKKNYVAKVVGSEVADGKTKVIISFIANDATHDFSGKAWINTTDQRFERIEYTIINCKKSVLAPIKPEDSLRVDSMRLSLDFDNSGPVSRLNTIRWNYGLNYKPFGDDWRNISTEAFFYFYEPRSRFLSPVFSSSDALTDYEKILAIPYSENFWKNNYVIPESHKQLAFKSFFKENGILLNYFLSTLSISNFSPLRRWDAKYRIDFKDLDRERSLALHSSSGSGSGSSQTVGDDVGRVGKATTIDEQYHIDAQVLLNPVSLKAPVEITSATLFNGRNSFYLPQENDMGRCFINITFDLFEMQKRRIDRKIDALAHEEIKEKELNAVFNSEMKHFNDTMKVYYREALMGRDLISLLHWNQFVLEHVGTDNLIALAEINSRLFNIKTKPFIDKLDPFTKHRYYNIGTALLLVKKYDTALEQFKYAINSGDASAETYYNRGLTYFYNSQLSKALEDWNIAGKMGDKDAAAMLEKNRK